MAEYEDIFDPTGDHPSGTFASKILASNALTNSPTGLKAGTVDDSSSYHNFVTTIFGKLPTKEDIYGAGVTDSNLLLTNLKLQFTLTTADTDDEFYVIQSVKDGQTKNFPNDNYNGPSYSGVEFDTTGDNAFRKWWDGTDYDSTSIVDTDVIEAAVYGYFRPSATGVITVDLFDYFKAKDLKWGDRFHFILRKIGGESETEFIEVDTSAGGYSNRTTNNWIDLILYYEDPEPSMPLIKLEADTDYRSAIVTMTTKPEEKDIVEFATIWKHDSTDTFENRIGVYYSSTNDVLFTGGNQFATGIFKEIDGDIADGFLNTTGETDNLVVWASDKSATGTGASSKNRTMSNRVSHARMECTASLSAGTAIGQELTLTIAGIIGDGVSTAKKFSKYAVHWENPTTSGGVIENFNIVTLEVPASSVEITHTYSKYGVYNVMVCVIDDKGFRSDFVRAGGATRTISEANPVAVLRSSRDTAVRARYGDEFSVVNLSLTHSYPVGSDRLLMTHKFKHNGTEAITTFPMDNDNSNFNDASTSVAVRCNTASCDDTVIKVYGKVSVDSLGDPIADDNVNFDHYEYQVNSVSPHTNKDTIGGVATTTASDASTDSVYYKAVDFVVISTLSGDDDGTLYTLVDIKYDHVSGHAADAGYGNVINNKIRGKVNTYAWGGYEVLTTGMTELNFNAGAKTITRDAGSGDFFTNGAAVGDTIYIAAPEDATNNNFFTVNTVAATVLTVDEDITTNVADTTATIYKVGPSVLSVAAYDEVDATITASVVSTVGGQSTTANLDTSSEVTQTISFVSEEINTLDLDTVADAGDIAILSATLSRGGGMAAKMSLGNKIYPTGAVRTRMGDPTVSLNVRALTQTGYRKLWNVIEGDTYEWTTIDSKKVDVPGTAYKQLRMRLTSGSLNKDPSMASQYTGTLNFIVIGELVT